jgi:hypothetical protein
MSGGGSSGGGGTQTTVQKSDPWAGQQPFLQQVYGLAQGTYGSAPMNFFPGQTYANLAPETEQALQMQTQRAQQGSPLTGAAQNQLTSTLQGDYLSAGNPYFSQMFDPVAGEVRSRIDSQFNRSGNYGSSAHMNAVASGLSNAASQLAYQNYQGERENQMKAGLLAPQIAQQDYFDASKLAEVGGVREDLSQQGINEQMARHDFYQMEPWQRLQLYNNLIQGNVGGTTTSETTAPRRSLGFGDILGGASSLGGLGLLAYSVLSDRRAKTDIKKVGMLDDGLPVYRYRYKGDPVPHIGVMAQDVEKVKPEAVVETPSGYKAVNYGLLGA